MEALHPDTQVPAPPAASPAGAPPAVATPGEAAPPQVAARPRRWRRVLLAGGLTLLVLVLAAVATAVAGGYSYRELDSVAPPRLETQVAPGEIKKLERRLAASSPTGVYITVDTVANRLYLKRGDEVLREAVCSAGTGAILEDPVSGRRWVFDSPRGAHKVLQKTRDPVWTKPDWAFIEEGEPLPKDFRERIDPYSLGDYALYFGDGFLIHGTLYQRYLGRNVTHGCIRLGDDDLAVVFKTAPVGTPVYIF